MKYMHFLAVFIPSIAKRVWLASGFADLYIVNNDIATNSA